MDNSASQAVTLHHIQHMRASHVKVSDISCNFHIVPPTSILSFFSTQTIREGLLADASNKNNKERGGEHIKHFIRCGDKGTWRIAFSKRRYSLSFHSHFFMQAEELYVAMQYRDGVDLPDTEQLVSAAAFEMIHRWRSRFPGDADVFLYTSRAGTALLIPAS